MRIHDFLWLIPFMCFFIGYFLTGFLFNRHEFMMPPLIGQSVAHALTIASELQLNPRILNIKEDADLPEGTIISQSPSQGQKIKSHQSIYIGISQKPTKITLPDLRQKTASSVAQTLADMNVHYKTFFVPSSYPSDYCCAQIPEPELPMAPTALAVCYFKTPLARPIIWPDFTGKTIAPIVEYLKEHGVSVEIIHNNNDPLHSCLDCTIYAQRPVSGSIVTILPNQPLLAQLYVK